MSRSEFVELEASFWLIARSVLFDVPSRNFSKKKLAHSQVRIVQLGLQLSDNWNARLKSCNVSNLTLQLFSKFKFIRQVHGLLKQLIVLTCKLDILDSIISVIIALHALLEEQSLVEVRQPL